MPIPDPAALLRDYQSALSAFRQESGALYHLPEVHFFLFGMGPRRKLIYQASRLSDARTGELLRQWDVTAEVILPPAYAVHLTTRQGGVVRIYENETGIWLEEMGNLHALSEPGRPPLHLPDFASHSHAPILRVLHQEILVNIIDGLPVPNFFVYPKPWYRDGAMMAMVLQATDNLALIHDWILALADPYDRNNAGETEADNLGQALYLLSLVSDSTHPLVPRILAELERLRVDNAIRGRSDFAEHAVYQTKWARFGLAAMGLPDPFQIPLQPDSYSALFWWAFRDRHVPGPHFNQPDYPYLDWAEAHFYNTARGGPVGDQDYPLSWEANASQANYAGLSLLSTLYEEQKISAPHTWHAAEMFLFLYAKKAPLSLAG